MFPFGHIANSEEFINSVNSDSDNIRNTTKPPKKDGFE